MGARVSESTLCAASYRLLQFGLVTHDTAEFNCFLQKGLNERLKPRTTVTLIPGDGIGPEMSQAAIGVMNGNSLTLVKRLILCV